MAQISTIDQVAHQAMLLCPGAGIPLCTLWALNAWNQFADQRDWSWRLRYGVFNVPSAYSTGTIAISNSDPTLVTGTGTSWTPDMVGRQLKVGFAFGYDIVAVIDGTHLRINLPWGDPDISGLGYIILQQFLTAPTDFHSFISVIDTTRNWRLCTGVERREIDRRDARRVTTGTPYVLAEAGYSTIPLGSVDATPTHARGTGHAPVFAGTYTGYADTLYVVEVTTGGASGTAIFKWKQGDGTYVTGVPTSPNAIGLIDGVYVWWPDDAGITYTVGDVFVTRASAIASSGVPRFELWPNQLTQSQYPFYYITQIPDLTAPGATLPSSIAARTDVLLQGAMVQAADWPGTDPANPNPYYDPKMAVLRRSAWMKEIDILALRDDDIYPKDVTYFKETPIAGLDGPPWDASWEQRHS